MVLIGTSETDTSSGNVIKWLIKYNEKYVRVGENLFINSLNLKITNNDYEFIFKIGKKKYNLNTINSFWSRKFTLKCLSNIKINLIEEEKNLDSPDLKKYLELDEINSIKELFYFELEKKISLGNHQVGDGNKLISFLNAKSVGLSIPTTIVSTNLNYLKKEFKNCSKLIGKPIEDTFVTAYNGINVSVKYNILPLEIFDNKEEEISPSCLQEYLDKKVEIRVFYLKGVSYSMAIFSQNDEQTKIDFRNYNDLKPNRMVPYNLPKDIEFKIDVFMKKMKLDTGSLDLILTHDNKYIFLEVNPVGQYGMVGERCNYPLDKLIALELIKKQEII